MAAVAGLAPIFQVIGGIASVGGLLMGMSSKPQMLPPPAAPTPEPAPVAPEVTEAKDVAIEDSPQRAAQMDAARRKRAKAEEDRRLMTLQSDTEMDTVSLTKSLLGE